MAGANESSSSKSVTNVASKGLESLSLGGQDNVEVNSEGLGESSSTDYFQVDSIEDFGHINFYLLSPNEIRQFHFENLDIAYDFYNEYSRAIGFSIRKHKVGYTRSGEPKEILWKSFVCSKQGARESKTTASTNPQRKARANTRCGCKASFRVHVDAESGRWLVTFFEYEHNHELMNTKLVGLMRSHRGMSDSDLAEMNMRNVGIPTQKIFASFARQSGGFDNVGFGRKDVYNQIDKQRKMRGDDAKAAFRYLRQLCTIDPLMYWKHEVDGDGNLKHIFWADGDSQIDYSVFGDLLAFDATYGRNKYKLPIVVFSGVNHHLQTVVFGCGIVADETEITYMWLLEQFLLAMKGKCPRLVITDGDMAMRNAIARVFPEAHHRLCAWHLLRNAKSNVGKHKFTRGFKECMFGDYEIDEFEAEWKAVVAENGVEDVAWVQDIYDMKKMWATAHMRGLFFTGVRTTSRCEGLHSQMGKYVGSRDNLYEFLLHFERCFNFMWNNEVHADFTSCNGDPRWQTSVPSLEMSAARVYTRDVFYLFREVLLELGNVNITGSKKTACSVIYVVSKYTMGQRMRKFHVSYHVADKQYGCSCRRMESLGLACVHIVVVVVVFQNIHELPESLILRRWTKYAKEGLERRVANGVREEMGNRITRFAVLQHCCRKLSSIACRSLDDFHNVRDHVNAEIDQLLATGVSERHPGVSDLHDNVRECGESSQVSVKKLKKRHTCTNCRIGGHNRRKCPYEVIGTSSTVNDLSSDGDVDEGPTTNILRFRFKIH